MQSKSPGRHFLFAMLLCPLLGWAHGDVHPMIDAITEEINAAKPPGLNLYLRRSSLFAQDGNFDRALADLGIAERMAPGQAPYALLRGNLYLDAGLPYAASVELSSFCSSHPKHLDAHLSLAKAAFASRDFEGCLAAYAIAEPLMMRPNLDVVLAHARACVALERMDEGLAVLEAGMDQLGRVIVLEDYAARIEFETGRLDAALTRINDIILRFEVEGPWYLRRAQVFAAQKKHEAALQDLDRLDAWLAALPDAAQALPNNAEAIKGSQTLRSRLTLKNLK